ncbi:MAG: HEPN domain-containing protein, partial [Asgard group archaeon]|nr:HEPN domain-containing protein [Asgard group archaeon]
ARYLEKYLKKGLLEEEWISLLDRVRDVRHMDQYNTVYHATEEEASSIINSAKSFVDRMKKLFAETYELK